MQLRIKDGPTTEVVCGGAPVRARLPPPRRAVDPQRPPRPGREPRRRRRARRPGRHASRRRRARSSAPSGWSGSRRTRPRRSMPRRRSASTTSASGPYTPRRPSRAGRRSGSSWSATPRSRAGPVLRDRWHRTAQRGRRPRRGRDADRGRPRADRRRRPRARPRELAPDRRRLAGGGRSWRSVAASAGSVKKPAGSAAAPDRDAPHVRRPPDGRSGSAGAAAPLGGAQRRGAGDARCRSPPASARGRSWSARAGRADRRRRATWSTCWSAAATSSRRHPRRRGRRDRVLGADDRLRDRDVADALLGGARVQALLAIVCSDLLAAADQGASNLLGFVVALVGRSAAAATCSSSSCGCSAGSRCRATGSLRPSTRTLDGRRTWPRTLR